MFHIPAHRSGSAAQFQPDEHFVPLPDGFNSWAEVDADFQAYLDEQRGPEFPRGEFPFR